MNTLKIILLGAALSVLHYFTTFMCLFGVIFARWDRAERPLATGEIVKAIFYNVMLRVFSFPLLLIGEWYYEGTPPDSVIYLLTALNSCLWGFSIVLLWNHKAKLLTTMKVLRRRRAIT